MGKKILVIEDNILLLKTIERTLQKESRFSISIVENAENGIELLHQEAFDLVITDINLPGKSGLDIIRYIREDMKSEMPIIVMSADNEDQMVVNALALGADDYLVKPAGINQLIIRILKLLKIPFQPTDIQNLAKGTINKSAVGIVIPCYNEEDRLSKNEFQQFVLENSSYHLCFVNDGSTDNTLQVLQSFVEGNEGYISVYDCEKNGGKAEAVRQGINYLLDQNQFEYVGFLDADLSTNFSDFEILIDKIRNQEYKAVCGSRIQRVGAKINKDASRAVISKMINMMIQFIIKIPFQDTQCGAKIFDKETAQDVFADPFLSRWLFDVEIFVKMRKNFGKEKAATMILEQPLERWVHMDGSKLSFNDSLKIFSELFKIYRFY